MSLQKLISHFQQTLEFPIKIEDIRKWILDNNYQEEINFYAVEVDEEVLRGVFKQYVRRNGMYGDTVLVTDIGYAASLNLCWQRLVCCKEMVHIFDRIDSKTYTAEQIDKLTFNLTSPSSQLSPYPKDLQSETLALLKALQILAPLPVIENLKDSYNDNTKSEYDIAYFLRIPECYINFLFSPHYSEICAVEYWQTISTTETV